MNDSNTTGADRMAIIKALGEAAAKDQQRVFKYYRITAAGKRQFAAEESKWKQMVGMIGRVLWPAGEG